MYKYVYIAIDMDAYSLTLGISPSMNFPEPRVRSFRNSEPPDFSTFQYYSSSTGYSLPLPSNVFRPLPPPHGKNQHLYPSFSISRPPPHHSVPPPFRTRRPLLPPQNMGQFIPPSDMNHPLHSGMYDRINQRKASCSDPSNPMHSRDSSDGGTDMYVHMEGV